ncbi:MAG: hypothetical protein ACRBBV_10420 [Paracoccaceae bacterium]
MSDGLWNGDIGDAAALAQGMQPAILAACVQGVNPAQYEVPWVPHTYEDRVALHFCTPRLDLTSGRSLNIAQPGYEKTFDSKCDVMNHRHGWAGPKELNRRQEVRDTIGPHATYARGPCAEDEHWR